MPNFEIFGEHEALEAINKFNPVTRGGASFFCRILHSNTLLSATRYKQAWADELGTEMTDEVWDECLNGVHDCSVNVRHSLIQFKTVHRLYYSRETLLTFFSDVSPVCNRCKPIVSNLTHAFWSCSKLYTYWKNIFSLFLWGLWEALGTWSTYSHSRSN